MDNLYLIKLTDAKTSQQIIINPLKISAIIIEDTHLRLLVDSEWFLIKESIEEIMQKIDKFNS